MFVFVVSLWFLQGVCQGERAGGEEARIPEAPQTAANRERVNWVPRVDLQSRSETNTHTQSFDLMWVTNVSPYYFLTNSLQLHLNKKILNTRHKCDLILTFSSGVVFVLQKRWCWLRKTRTQRRNLWMEHGTKGNTTTLVRTAIFRIIVKIEDKLR